MARVSRRPKWLKVRRRGPPAPAAAAADHIGHRTSYGQDRIVASRPWWRLLCPGRNWVSGAHHHSALYPKLHIHHNSHRALIAC